MIEIELFGATTVRGETTSLLSRDLGGSKPRQVLEILALELGEPVTKDALADKLWEGCPPRSYIATLESYACGLRRKLKDISGVPGALVTTVGGYALDPAHVRVDVVELREVLRTGDLPLMRHTLGRAGESLLAQDAYASWADQERQQLAEERRSAYLRAAREANAVGDAGVAIRFARGALAECSWCEPATQELMTALAGSGNHSQALVEYQNLRDTMSLELGVEPSPATQALYLSILRVEGATGADVSLLVSLLKSALGAAMGRETAASPEAREVGRMLLSMA